MTLSKKNQLSMEDRIMTTPKEGFLSEAKEQLAKQARKIFKGYVYLCAIKGAEKILIEMPLKGLHKTCEIYGLDKDRHIPDIKKDRKIYKH